jgi:hypothetical protein
MAFPITVTTTQPFTLLDKAGKETPIPLGSSIKVMSRGKLGSLAMEINGAIFVGNEERLLGKIEAP